MSPASGAAGGELADEIAEATEHAAGRDVGRQ